MALSELGEAATYKEKAEERNIGGVAAVILSQDGRILVVQETVDKPRLDKQAGDWSIPAETVEQGETELEALLRLIKEEVGENGDIICNPQVDWIGDYGFAAGLNIWVRAYVLHFNGSSKTPRPFNAERNEVINHCWIDPSEIWNLPRRKGVFEVVRDFSAGRREVICEECSPGFRPNQS